MGNWWRFIVSECMSRQRVDGGQTQTLPRQTRCRRQHRRHRIHGWRLWSVCHGVTRVRLEDSHWPVLNSCELSWELHLESSWNHCNGCYAYDDSRTTVRPTMPWIAAVWIQIWTWIHHQTSMNQDLRTTRLYQTRHQFWYVHTYKLCTLPRLDVQQKRVQQYATRLSVVTEHGYIRKKNQTKHIFNRDTTVKLLIALADASIRRMHVLVLLHTT